MATRKLKHFPKLPLIGGPSSAFCLLLDAIMNLVLASPRNCDSVAAAIVYIVWTILI